MPGPQDDTPAAKPDPEREAANQFGEEPAEESGAGYGNHATPGPADEPSQPGKDAR